MDGGGCGLLVVLLGGLLVCAAADDPGAVAGWATIGLGAGVLVSATPLPAGVRCITVPLIRAAASVLYAMTPTFWRDSLAVTGSSRSLTQDSAPVFALLWWSAAVCLLAGSVFSVWIAVSTGPGTGRRRDPKGNPMG